MKSQPFMLLLPVLMLVSCGGNSSSTKPVESESESEPVSQSVASSEAETTSQSSSRSSASISLTWDDDDPFADYTWSTVEVERETFQIQIGGAMSAFPQRVWNPEAAPNEFCFAVDSKNPNRYNFTYEFKKGDSFLFFFDYSWDTVIGFDGVDWDYDPSLSDIDAYVTDAFEGEDVSSKHTEIHILQDVSLTFSYFTFGVLLDGMKTGMALTGLVA